MIVDDKPINCRILELLMKKWSLVPTVVSDHVTVVPHLQVAAGRGNAYDVAVLDCDLASFDGLQLAQTVVGSVAPPPRVILLTSVGKRGDAKAAKAMGISAYLTKPLRESQLLRCLEMVLEPGAAASPHGAAESGAELVTRHTLAEATRAVGMKILLAEDLLSLIHI